MCGSSRAGAETCEWELTCQIDWHYAITHAIIEVQLKEIEHENSSQLYQK